jgi:NAD(P)-dependent dehydrogenase (short-subunit alcohol dehydrogenase family)
MRSVTLEGDDIIVVGGAGLIGTAVTRHLGRLDANVFCCDLPRSDGEDLAESLDSNVSFAPLDVTDPEMIDVVVEEIQTEAGGIDGMVNCSYPRGDGFGADFWDVRFEDWNETFEVHLGSYFYVAREVAKAMKEVDVEGSIVNFASVYGIQAPNFSIYEDTSISSPVEYAAMKSAIVNLTRYMASYLGPEDIRVNAVSPGGVFDEQDPKFVENYEDRVPLGRMAEPDDIVGPVSFLLSDAASYVTGHNLVVDGGWTIS